MTESPYLNDPWCRLLPTLHRALANPNEDHGLPDRPLKDRLLDACAYWETLHYLLHVLVGWEDLATGLAWWYGNGKKDFGDPRLQLLNKVWDSEGQLDYFAAWAWTQKGWNQTKWIGKDSAQACPPWLNENWWRTMDQRTDCSPYNPYQGGGNALHLEHSNFYGFVDSMAEHQAYSVAAKQQAVLIVSHIESWRTELRAFGQTLPSLGLKSWHVEVFDRQTGYLGLFRQSRITQRWFQGKHGIHMAGRAT